MPPGRAPSHLFSRITLAFIAPLALAVSLPLLVAPADTAQWFVFPIEPPVTAGFIGACYLAAALFMLLAAMSPDPGAHRIALIAALVFSGITTFVSLLNLPMFDRASALTWAWMVLYVLVTLLAALALVAARAHQPSPGAALPRSLRILCAILMLATLPLGVGLLFSPSQVAYFWPWVLTPPNAAYRSGSGTSLEPYLGAWLIAIAATLGAALFADRPRPARPAFAALALLAILLLFTLIRFRADVNLASPAAIALFAAIALLALAGLRGASLRAAHA